MADWIWPVPVTLVGMANGPWILDDDQLVINVASTLGWTPPWSWYPKTLAHSGIAARIGDDARAWFAGIPQGQERRVWDTLLDAVGRRRQILSPLTTETIQRVAVPLVHIAVLTTPG